MPSELSRAATARRDFLKTAALAGAGFFIADRSVAAADAPAGAPPSPAGKINVGFVGVTNQGSFDLTETSNVPNVNVAALCDVDDNRLGEAAKKFPSARKFSDWRRLLDDSHDLDAIVIAIPDHHHALVTMGALQLHKHVYCEKPLTHTVREARLVAKTAVANKCVTQMGTQIHAGSNYRRAVEIIQAGVIGEVTEAHVWCNTQWTADEPPTDTPPIPAGLHYDIWLGPADYRPYSPAYLPANWRRWWAFGSGTLGDMGCHYQDLAFWALGLRHPTKISAEGPPVHKEGTPAWLIVTYEYPARAASAGEARLVRQRQASAPVRGLGAEQGLGKRGHVRGRQGNALQRLRPASFVPEGKVRRLRSSAPDNPRLGRPSPRMDRSHQDGQPSRHDLQFRLRRRIDRSRAARKRRLPHGQGN